LRIDLLSRARVILLERWRPARWLKDAMRRCARNFFRMMAWDLRINHGGSWVHLRQFG
jgi:hypothetical protein